MPWQGFQPLLPIRSAWLEANGEARGGDHSPEELGWMEPPTASFTLGDPEPAQAGIPAVLCGGGQGRALKPQRCPPVGTKCSECEVTGLGPRGPPMSLWTPQLQRR